MVKTKKKVILNVKKKKSDFWTESCSGNSFLSVQPELKWNGLDEKFFFNVFSLAKSKSSPKTNRESAAVLRSVDSSTAGHKCMENI